MLNLRLVFIVLSLMLVLIPANAGIGSENVAQPEGYTPRAPIFIATDEDFTAENGVVGGTGTADDPYVISGWYIAPDWDEGITNYRAITIGGQVRLSFFLVENNYMELHENLTIGVSIGSSVGGTVRDNVIVATGFETIGVVLSTGVGVDNMQDPMMPLRVENNTFTGQIGKGQKGLGFSGTAISVSGNRFHDLDIGVNIAASLTIGHQLVRIHNNDFIDVDWAAPAALVQVNTLNIPIIDARNNYWGHPEGPTIALCTNTLGCNIAPLGEYGAKVAPNVLAYPYAEEPFYPED